MAAKDKCQFLEVVIHIGSSDLLLWHQMSPKANVDSKSNLKKECQA